MSALTIGLLVYPDCLPAGLFAFADILRASNLHEGSKRFKVCWLSVRGGEVSAAPGLSVTTEPLQASSIDVLLVPGAWRDAENVISQKDSELVQSLKQLPSQVRLFGYCTGVIILARAGRLDGMSATTTWWLHELAGQTFPSVSWKPHETLVYTSTHATASGVHGYLPLALAFIEERCGTSMVNGIRRHMVLPRPEGRETPLQEVPMLLQRSSWVRSLIQLIEVTSPENLAIVHLAEALNIAPRTLQRRTLKETGISCGKLMRLVKMNQVGEQLITTDRSVAMIASAIGFRDEASLRRSFRQVVGMTPGAYRKRM
ncbi:hypothetical protein CWE09_02130 [Aliidiomarina minuta]|uniref:HTH araC/xylS-type domain-containing protein n=1 Tax=Aliidiomarina minuta TaxID=880057 RepID=A0A432W651_9GAMM|nr:helix-turn-helix domain-containing protein [Aliidiomarina minuta]RUO25554.1 hypothetical protein CWE09_02130 [Aliidiomarina minuta]